MLHSFVYFPFFVESSVSFLFSLLKKNLYVACGVKMYFFYIYRSEAFFYFPFPGFVSRNKRNKRRWKLNKKTFWNRS